MDYLSILPFMNLSGEKDCATAKLSDADRFTFWIGGTLVMFSTLFLIIGNIRFKELRKQPGDLILGIALSDFALSIHWIVLAIWPDQVEDELFCKINGVVGTLG